MLDYNGITSGLMVKTHGDKRRNRFGIGRPNFLTFYPSLKFNSIPEI